jgi:hypothetical protein
MISLIVHGAADPAAMGTIVEILCGVDRPERASSPGNVPPTVQALLTGLSCGDIPLSHDGLDAAGRSRQVSHLRSLLEHNGVLPPRDEHLARFESWLACALDDIPDSAVRAPSNSSPPGIICAGFAATRRPGKPPTGRDAQPNNRSPRRSNSSPGCTTPITAPRPPADSKTSTSG